ncbi:MAG: hypothetical protein LC105_10860 [Chitinophagales bacterium]|nr:hypothetical protein [Chitinophagales bacterium]MCZ2394350.1 hypothetical protein [Chitinophagales bacterium]
MRKGVFVLLLTLLISCKEKTDNLSHLVTQNLNFFKLYDATCEEWLEQKYPCRSDSCFSSTAVEIVAIDTLASQSYKIFAWTWVEHFLLKNGKVYSGNKKLQIARFTLNPDLKDKNILDVYIPSDTLAIREQLEAEKFPEDIVNTYFIDQPESNERMRIKALNQKSKDKFELFLKNSYENLSKMDGDSLMIE